MELVAYSHPASAQASCYIFYHADCTTCILQLQYISPETFYGASPSDPSLSFYQYAAPPLNSVDDDDTGKQCLSNLNCPGLTRPAVLGSLCAQGCCNDCLMAAAVFDTFTLSPAVPLAQPGLQLAETLSDLRCSKTLLSPCCSGASACICREHKPSRSLSVVTTAVQDWSQQC